jgi:hypothetical protein
MEDLLAVERELEEGPAAGDSPAVSPQKLPSALVEGGSGDLEDRDEYPSEALDAEDEGAIPAAPAAGPPAADDAAAPAVASAAAAAAAQPFHAAGSKKSGTLKKIKKLFKTGKAKDKEKEKERSAGAAPTTPAGGGHGAGGGWPASPAASPQSHHRKLSMASSHGQQEPQAQPAAGEDAPVLEQQDSGQCRQRRRWASGAGAGAGSGSGSARTTAEEADGEPGGGGGSGAHSALAGGSLSQWSGGAAGAGLPQHLAPPGLLSSGRFDLAAVARCDSGVLGTDDGTASSVAGYGGLDSRYGTINSSAASSYGGTLKGLLGPRKKHRKQIELDALRCGMGGWAAAFCARHATFDRCACVGVEWRDMEAGSGAGECRALRGRVCGGKRTVPKSHPARACISCPPNPPPKGWRWTCCRSAAAPRRTACPAPATTRARCARTATRCSSRWPEGAHGGRRGCGALARPAVVAADEGWGCTCGVAAGRRCGARSLMRGPQIVARAWPLLPPLAVLHERGARNPAPPLLPPPNPTLCSSAT